MYRKMPCFYDVRLTMRRYLLARYMGLILTILQCTNFQVMFQIGGEIYRLCLAGTGMPHIPYCLRTLILTYSRCEQYLVLQGLGVFYSYARTSACRIRTGLCIRTRGTTRTSRLECFELTGHVLISFQFQIPFVRILRHVLLHSPYVKMHLITKI